MSEATGDRKHIEELEAAVFEALDHYFEAHRREVAENKEREGTELVRHEELRRRLAEAEGKLLEVHARLEELQVRASSAVIQSREASELEEEVSALQAEIHELAEVEKAAQERKKEVEKTLQQLGDDLDADIGLAMNRVAGTALQKVEEIDTFKDRLDQYFVEERTSILETGY
jgi:chromosome segregation ATPase